MTLALWQPPAFLRTCREGELWNAILSYRDHPLVKEGWDVFFKFSAIARPDPGTRALTIQPNNGPRFIVIINSFPFAGMFGAELEMSELARLPQTLRSSLEDGIVSALWRAIPDNQMGDVRIVAAGTLEQIS